MEHTTTNSGSTLVKFHCVAGTRDEIGHVSCLARQRNCNLMPSAIIAENVKLELIIFSQPANETSLYLLDQWTAYRENIFGTANPVQWTSKRYI